MPVLQAYRVAGEEFEEKGLTEQSTQYMFTAVVVVITPYTLVQTSLVIFLPQPSSQHFKPFITY